MHRDRLLLTVRVGRVERCYDLVVVAASLAIAEELDPFDLDLLRAGLGLEQRDGLVGVVVERHGELAVLLAGQEAGPDGWGHSSTTFTVVPANCSRIDSLSMWMAAFDAL